MLDRGRCARAARGFLDIILEPLSDSPSCGGYASVLEAFGRISQHFPSWYVAQYLVRLWMHILRQLADGFGRIGKFLYVVW